MAICGALLCPTAFAEEPDRWTPQTGDRVVVDVSISVVYLVHPDGSYVALDALTGQNKIVAYDGIIYKASTPEREWLLDEDAFEKKGRSMTFGEGRFLRLSWPGHKDPRRGNETTAYGIHSHLTFAKMMQEKKDKKKGWDTDGTGHRSMGCILLSEEDLTLVEETWRFNDERLAVSTQGSVDPLAFAPENMRPSWLGLLVR